MQKERDTEPQPLTLEAVAARAKEDLLRDGKHRPTLIAEGGLRTVVAQVSEFGRTHEQRAKQMFVMGFSLAQSGEVAQLEQAFFISEAWMSERRDGQAPHSPPSQDPNRKEVLLVSRFKPDDEAVDVAVLEMVRDRAGQLTEVREFQEQAEAQPLGQSPLLAAFAAGYRLARSAGQN